MQNINENIEDSKLIKIVSANYLNDYSIQLIFDDGTSRTINFKPFLEKSSHPSIKKYLNIDMFMLFKIVYGNLDWNDFDLCFPIWDLYTGNI